MSTTGSISTDQIEIYRETARRREAEDRQRLHDRFERAWLAAKAGANMLKTKYGVARVAVFGSLVDESLFHHRSDIDLAVWGLDTKEYLHALADLLSTGDEFSFDLVEVEDVQLSLRTTIEREGVEL